MQIRHAQGFSPPSQEKPALHHHHVQRHHHHATPSKPLPPVDRIIPMPTLTILSQSVLDRVKDKPRTHLGYAFYDATLRPHRRSKCLDAMSESGFASTPRPLPDFTENENCTFTVKVHRVHLSPVSREEITSRKAVWGTDVYSDDSDIIAACIHQGWFRGRWHEDVDVSLLGLDKTNPNNIETDVVADGPDEMISSLPANGPGPVPSNRDLEVEILVLPALEKYASSTRFGIKSREWGGRHHGSTSIHDGLSFMIRNIKWVNGLLGTEKFENKKRVTRRKTLRRELEEAAEVLEEASGNKLVRSGGSTQSFERGMGGGFKGLGKDWWTKSRRELEDGEEVEGKTNGSRVVGSGSHDDVEAEARKSREVEEAVEALNSIATSPTNHGNDGAAQSLMGLSLARDTGSGNAIEGGMG